MIDLTHTLNSKMTVYPGTTAPSFEQSNTINKDGFAELDISIRTHVGTHVDAPCHIVPGGKTLDEIPLDKFIGNAIVIDCSNINSIELEFIKRMEEKIEESDIILFYTGWHKKWNTPDYLDDFPTLTIETVEWLLNFDLKALGFDVISVDKMGSQELPNHNLLLKNEILIIENLTNLDKLLNKQFEFNCIPLKIEGADGSPVRAFARILID